MATKLPKRHKFSQRTFTGLELFNRKEIQALAGELPIVDVAPLTDIGFPSTIAKSDSMGNLTIITNRALLNSLVSAIKRAEIDKDYPYLNYLYQMNFDFRIAYPAVPLESIEPYVKLFRT